jgi:hypothetical protein
MKPKILFISNKRSLYTSCNISPESPQVLSSGLSNSITFVVDMLKSQGYDVKYEQVIDGNSIDKVVSIEKPNIVIIEAIWVTPSKMRELSKLHKKIKWIVRIHSELPFLSNEGNALKWLIEFSNIHNVFIAANSDRATKELELILERNVFYLPNYYPIDKNLYVRKPIGTYVDIGCFGAIRPMKNQLLQAVAAIQFAKDINKPLRFHINTGREESGGGSVLKNLKALFEQTDVELIEHPWAKHSDFLKILEKIDIGMQASLSETYNIVTADMVNKFIPVVVSEEIRWVLDDFKIHPTSFKKLVSALHFCYNSIGFNIIRENKEKLADDSKKSTIVWKHFINKFY